MSSVGGAGGPRGFDHVDQSGDAERAGETQAAGFPRSGWKDQEALGKAVRTAESGVERSRPNQRMRWVEAKRSGETSGASSAGPASLHVAKRGGTSGTKHAGSPSTPVIAMKYGGPFLHPGGGTDPVKPPVIAMKYGGPFMHPGGGTHDPTPHPVIVMKYGGPNMGGGGGHTPAPVIVMKYGGPNMRPRE